MRGGEGGSSSAHSPTVRAESGRLRSKGTFEQTLLHPSLSLSLPKSLPNRRLAPGYKNTGAISVCRLSCRPDVLHPGIMHKLADPHPVKARLNIQMRPRLYCIAGGGAEERSCWLRADIGPGRFGPNGIALRELVQHRLPEEIAPPTYPLIRPSYLLGARHYAPLTTIITIHIHRTDFEQATLTLARLRRAVRVGSLDRQAMAPLLAPRILESAR